MVLTVHSKPNSTGRDRRESDLLLDAVLAHMAYNSGADRDLRAKAHADFKQAVRRLEQFLSSEETAAPTEIRAPERSGTT